MQLFDLDLNKQFMWQDSVYELKSTDDPDRFQVICIARKANYELYIPTGSQALENFNPYADVEPGKLKVVWEPL